MNGVVATLRLGRTLCEDHSSVVGRLIFLVGLEIESKWKKGTNKGETILMQVEDRSKIFFLENRKLFFLSGERTLKVCV